MKKSIILTIVTSMCILSSCGKTVGSDKENINETENVTESTSSTEIQASESKTEQSEIPTQTKTERVIKKDIPESVVLEYTGDLEVYQNITVGELITDTNAVIAEPEQVVDTTETGGKSIDVIFEYEGNFYKKKLEYTVSDTTDPLILNMGWDPYTRKGENFDINSIIGYVDNFDRSPEVSYSGEVNTSEVGHYPISVTVSDHSGNSTSWDMEVFVVNEIPAPEDNNPRVTFSDFMNYYCYENVSYGIDVSAWQTNVDYEAVRSEGCEFVIMRMGYCYGEIKMDDYYMQNMERATNAGLDVGVYFYTTANTEDKAREQARWIVEQLDGRELDYPVAFDWEEWGRFQKYEMNIHDLNEVFEAFCDELEKNGYTGMLYSSKNFLNTFWENKRNRPVWLAHYVDETDYEGSFAIWQASAYGRINGIDGDVDMNIRIKDVPVW